MTSQDTENVSVTCGYCRFRQATGAMDTASGLYPACPSCQARYRVIAYRIVSLVEYLARVVA
jgi:hypothetical protein